jgi:hypothetical protein
MTHAEARIKFTKMVAELLSWAVSMRFLIAVDEAAQHQCKGHMAQSLHYPPDCVALDFVLYEDEGYGAPLRYRDGSTPEDVEQYRQIGTYWKSLDPLNRWGGDFKKVDLDHISYADPELVGGRA